jgi:hypothetical protein
MLERFFAREVSDCWLGGTRKSRGQGVFALAHAKKFPDISADTKGQIDNSAAGGTAGASATIKDRR